MPEIFRKLFCGIDITDLEGIVPELAISKVGYQKLLDLILRSNSCKETETGMFFLELTWWKQKTERGKM